MPTSQTSSVSTIAPARSRQHTPSRRSRSSYRYESKLKRYRALLAGISILLGIVLIFSFLNQTKKSSEYHQMLLDLRKQEARASKLGKELETTRSERDILVQQRIPGLIPMVYDETINVDNTYVRNIIFTMAKTGKKNIYEYRLVLHNNTLAIARPKTEIILFNDVGIQIGMAQIEQSDAITETGARTALDPGEVRSYTAAIDLIRDEQPSYFLLIIKETSNSATEKLRKQLNGVITDG